MINSRTQRRCNTK